MIRAASYRKVCGLILAVIIFCLCGCGCTAGVASDNSITDIRISAKTRPDIFGKPEYTLVRIYYGFYRNGIWYDHPSEHYDLKSIFDTAQYKDYQAAGTSHLVKIGPYVVICISHLSFDGEPGMDEICEITDTLGSTVEEPFTEYYTTCFEQPEDQLYAYYKRDGLQNDYIERFFRHYYFLVLEYESLPEDYVLECKYIYTSKTVTETLTYADIVQLVEGPNE